MNGYYTSVKYMWIYKQKIERVFTFSCVIRYIKQLKGGHLVYFDKIFNNSVMKGVLGD